MCGHVDGEKISQKKGDLLRSGGPASMSRRLSSACSARLRRVRRTAHYNGNAKVSQGLWCVARAALSQGQAQYFLRKVRHRFRSRRNIFEREKE